MSKAIVCDITGDFLKCSNADSDRFVYSNYYVPLFVTFDDKKTPILPFYTKNKILETFQHGYVDPGRVSQTLQGSGLSKLFVHNQIQIPDSRHITSSGSAPSAQSTGASSSKTALASNLKDTSDLLKVLSAKIAPADQPLMGVVN